MNKIYKVMYSKVKQCAVVVSEIAKSHSHNGESSGVRKHAALTAAVLIALGGVSFITNPEVAYADTKLDNGYYIGISDANTSRTKDDNANGKGARGTDSITIGHNSTASNRTITIGDRRADDSEYSVYLGEHYDSANQQYPDPGNYVTSIGYDSDARGKGSIALGSGAEADVNRDLEGNKKNPDADSASVAIGYNAKANKNNIAIGAGSVATAKASTADAYLTGQAAVSSYVSVGGGTVTTTDPKTEKPTTTTVLRRLTNVADGAADTDVATVGQLKKLSDKAGVYNEGWGINIDKTNGNTISVNHNLGNNMNAQLSSTGLILGGDFSNTYDGKYGGAAGDYAVTLGGESNFALGKSSVAAGGMDNTADGNQAFVGGGSQNTASEHLSSAIGGSQNTASGVQSSAFGGSQNTASGQLSSAIGGDQNTASGFQSSAIGGDRNIASGWLSSTLGGMKSVVLGLYATGIAGGSTGSDASNALAAGSNSVVTVADGTAIGYQATTNERGTIAFGHDKDDISGYTVTWKQKATSTGGKYYNAKGVEITKDQYEALRNPDYTFNDYSKDPEINEDKYKTAAYNRLVKVADGKDDHDVVVMEQLKNASNASNVGNNIKVYKTDENGNVQFDENNKPIEDTSDAAKTAQNGSKDAWGKALGAAPFTAGTATTVTNASTSDQLVTGKTLYDYDKPTDSQNYVKVNNTTGQNLSALDAQVKANADALTKPNHNIKYYAVDETTLPKLTNFNGKDYSNEKNNGAVGMGSIAAGFNTHADGIASTVAGSYSGVVGTGLQGAAALSYGTFNVNKNAAQAGTFSGVANSIVGQANVTTDSNAAIIYGAGNTVKNSYRDIDTKNASEIMAAAGSGDVTKLSEALQKAVPTSGGQVMVMGGGNSVENAYMTQVTGVGNTVTGSGEKYDKDSSTQLNYVDGFYTTLENGKNDYIIGSHNTVTGTSTDKNKSNIVFGDNHTLKNTKNNVILGSLDAVDETTVSDVVSIGHDAKVSAEGGVAIGSGSVVSENNIAGTIGYDPLGAEHKDDTTGTWKSTDGAVSVGGSSSDGKTITRQITNVAAGTNPTDVVNVAQLQNATEDLTNKGLKFKGDDNQEVTRKLNDTLTLKGGVTNTSDLSTAANIGVVKDGDGGLKIELAKNLTGLTSVTTGNTTIDNSGLTIKNDGDTTKNIVINSNNVSLGGNTITNMGSGLGKTYTEEGDNNSATIGDVKNLADARKTTVKSSDGTVTVTDKNTANADSHDYDLSVNYGKAASNLTLNYTGDNNTKGSNKLNESVAFNGTAGQIETKAANGKVTFKLADDMKTKTIMVTGENGNDGQIGLKGKDGKDGTVTTIIKTIGKNGTDGKPGVDGKDGITRIVYQDGKDGESGTTTHTVATLDDGLKFKGDDNQEVTRKLDETLTLKGGVTNTGDLSTAANIGVIKDGDGGLKIELAKNLTGLTSVTTGNTTIDNSGLTIKNATDATKNIVINSNNVSLGGNTITNMGSGADASGNYTNTANAANVGDVQNIVKKAVDAASDATNQALAGKANVDASNLTPDNVTKWQEKLGNGKVESGNTGLVTGDTVFKAVDTKANRDGSNLTDKEADSFSEKIARGEVKAGENRAVSGDAVSQAISKVTGDMNTKLDGKANTSLDNITDTGKNVIRDLAKGSVKVIDGTNTTVTTVEGKGEKPTTYAVNVEGKGTVTSGNTGLISGGTAYTELRPADGSYVKQNSTTAANLSALDKGLKTTSDLIHTNDKGDIQIGGSSTMKIDVHGKDGKDRVITGVVTNANDPTSAANVDYVNGVTAANTQQIYRDMNNAYGRLNNNINKAAAGSNALAALHPLDYDPDDKADFAVGYGHYRNANAAAVGAFYHPNENTMVNVGVSLGNGDPGFNAGVSFKIGSGSADRQAMSKTEMAKVINSQSKEIDALKKDNADKDKRIDALEQKMAEILAKLDKNGQ
ncbi:YadA-like family protein [Dialister succinatiphilus]|uniref:YadA-like family protein n=1 Tax=Dialister succinatiphilus TaxID=487173 RepID=UPI003AB7A9AD